jgi:hypothetical protein
MRDHITETETGGFAEALLNAGAKVGHRDEILKSTSLGWAGSEAARELRNSCSNTAPTRSKRPPDLGQGREPGRRSGAHAEIIELLRRYGA